MATDKTQTISVRLPVGTVRVMLEEAEGRTIGAFLRDILERRFPVPSDVGKTNRRARNSRTPMLRDTDA